MIIKILTERARNYFLFSLVTILFPITIFTVSHDRTNNNRNITHQIATHQIATLLAQHLQTMGKLSQHFSTTYRNIVGRNMLRAFGDHAATCCDMFGIENLTSAHALVQHCYTDKAKRYNIMQHPQIYVGWKI